MIRAEFGDEGTILVADLPTGSRAFIDRDWLPASSGDVAAMVVSPDGGLASHDGPMVEAWAGVDPVTAAARTLLTVARDAAAAVERVAPVAITGRGLVARRVRNLVGPGRGSEEERPRAIVETTGDPSAILDATRRVAELGIVVLAGESLGRKTELDLYPDVHVRGVTLVGVAPALDQARSAAIGSEPLDANLARWCLDLLGEIRSGSVLADDAAWYCLTV